MKFEHTKVYNFMGAIRNMRNSWESWDKIDSLEHTMPYVTSPKEVKHHANVENFQLGEADKALALRLIHAGSDHAKFLRQILISVDITAGNEWWKEADTYKVGTVANSTSMMHKLGSRLLTADDFSFDQPISAIAQKQIDVANEAVQAWWDSGKKQRTQEWRDMQKAIPMGFLYKRGFTANYQVLRAMYFSRKNHRLAEWETFRQWVESLPYSELITAEKPKKKVIEKG